jgi:transposase
LSEPISIPNPNHAMFGPGNLTLSGSASFSVTLSGLYAMQQFARTLRGDIDAVRNAIAERRSNGQTEGQINRPKTLKRAMYGRAGPELLRARMSPL